MAVITQQPGANTFGSMPGTLQSVLSDADYLRIKQRLEMCEICCCNCCEMENKYTVHNVHGVQLLKLKEESCCCCRYGCGAVRPWDMYATDPTGKQVMRFDRPLRCTGGCCPCCRQSLTVYINDVAVGSVSQNCGCVRPEFDIFNANDDHVLTVKGPMACCNCCCESCCFMCGCRTVGFKVTTADGDQEIGIIRKEHSGIAKETFTDADNFYLTFPRDLDMNLKATLLGSVVLIDYMYFEKSPPKEASKVGAAGAAAAADGDNSD